MPPRRQSIMRFGRMHASRWLMASLLGAGLRLPGQSATPRSSPPGTSSAAATEAFRKGSAAFAAGNFEGAHAAFARLVALAPGVAAAHAAFGSVLLAEGRLPGAIAELTEARRLDPNQIQATVNLALAHGRLGDPAAAVAMFRSLPAGTAMQPEEVAAYAAALAGTDDRAEAETIVRAATAANPQAPVLWDTLGALEAQARQYPAAAEDFHHALAVDPGYPRAYAHLGSLLLLEGDAAGALTALEAAAKLGDTDLPVRLDTGRALTALGRDTEAIVTLRKVATDAPNTPDIEYALALALQAGGQAADAVPIFAKVVAARPKDATALANYGLALVHTGDAKGALVLYARAAAAGSATATLYQDTGVAYLQTNDIDHALEQFRAGLALDPESAQLHYDLGLAFKLKDDLAAAVPELERAQALDPKLPDPPYTLGMIEMQQGKSAEAIESFRRTVALRPTNGEAWALLGSVEKDSGDLPGAAEALRHAVELEPDQPSPHITLAAVYTAQGNSLAAAGERKQAAALSRSAMSRQRAEFALKSGRTLLQQGHVPEAIAQLNDALAAEPELREGHLLLADALEKQGRPADALQERKKAGELPHP